MAEAFRSLGPDSWGPVTERRPLCRDADAQGPRLGVGLIAVGLLLAVCALLLASPSTSTSTTAFHAPPPLTVAARPSAAHTAYASPARPQRAQVRQYAEADSAVVANPREAGFALALDDGTRKAHSMAENSAFVTGFFKGIANKDAFARLVASLYFVYVAMEEAFDAAEDPLVKSLDYPELRRVPSLEEDMAYYWGPNWRTAATPSPATVKYVARIKEVAATAPRLLVAHQYTRYLGDLFGGQMMSGMAVRSLKLDENKGVAFYKFKQIRKPKDFITEWYQKLNALGVPEAEQAEVVDEANLVFRYNIEIFEELEGNAASSVFRLAWSSFLDLFKR